MIIIISIITPSTVDTQSAMKIEIFLIKNVYCEFEKFISVFTAREQYIIDLKSL